MFFFIIIIYKLSLKKTHRFNGTTNFTRGYKYRYVIRPRVRSYGEISIKTLSLGNTLIERVRIFPPKWHRTMLSFANLTLKNALGSASSTTPSHVIPLVFSLFCLCFAIVIQMRTCRSCQIRSSLHLRPVN